MILYKKAAVPCWRQIPAGFLGGLYKTFAGQKKKITGGKNMDGFEYKTLFTDAKGMLGGKVDQGAFQRELNELGRQGWELVSTVAAAQSYGSTRWIISTFKRKIE